METTTTTNILTDSHIKKGAALFRALNHKFRKRILLTILESSEPMTVTDIYVKLRAEQAVVSQHIRILRQSGILHPERLGKWIYYKADQDTLNTVKKLSKIIQAEIPTHNAA